jgi:hypothetical protein
MTSAEELRRINILAQAAIPHIAKLENWIKNVIANNQQSIS